MIARMSIPILLLLVLTDAYFLRRYGRKIWPLTLPTLPLAALTLWFSFSSGSFVPEEVGAFNWYLFALAVTLAPKVAFVCCSVLGRRVRRLLHSRSNYGNLVGLVLALCSVAAVIYGSTSGISHVQVKHVTIESRQLPDAFDGYRIVLFSDLHVGTFNGWREPIMRAAIDSINAQKADAIAFAGDLQNMFPTEIYPYMDLLNGLQARDGVFAVLGNHDYDCYQGDDLSQAEKVANCRETASRERQLGWTLLQNSHALVTRGGKSIVFAGEEDANKKQHPDLCNVEKTMQGVDDDAFVVMLQHDPRAWRDHILSKSQAQLTLSGHTHGGQVRLLGWSPVSLVYDEYAGLYTEGTRTLYVTTGVGALLPFRLGVPPEIVVITLRRSL